MKIVNAHVHMVELRKIMSLKTNKVLSGNPVYKNPLKMLPLLLPRTLISQMDNAGIEKSVLYALEAPIVYSSNSYVGKLCKKYPNRFIGFGSVNPLKENAAGELEETIKKFGFKGVKLHPPLQNFYPNDRKIFPVYEMLSKLHIPVVFHVGSTPFGNMVKLDQANPLLLDEVANRFPKLKIMLTHLGTLWDREAFMVVEKHPNVYIDTSAYIYEIPEILTDHLIKRVGENKIIFGTDYPTPNEGKTHKMKDFVECINSLDIDEKTKERIFSKNFYEMIGGKAK